MSTINDQVHTKSFARKVQKKRHLHPKYSCYSLGILN